MFVVDDPFCNIGTLYLNILSQVKEERNDLKFDFQFLTEDEAKLKDDDTWWFKVFSRARAEALAPCRRTKSQATHPFLIISRL
jgi:hypothetical protein